MEKNRKIELSTMIGKGSVVKGTLDIKGGIRVDGEVEGSIHSDGFILIGTSGVAKSELKAKECLVSGTVDGDIQVQDQLELERSARVNGNIIARILRIHAGAVLNGNCSMTDCHSAEKQNTKKAE